MVAGLHVGDTLANGLNDTSALVPEDNGEVALRVLARECVRILKTRQHSRIFATKAPSRFDISLGLRRDSPVWQTPV